MNEGFSPNADGYNDTWEITYLNQYSNVKVEIFNDGVVRYGSLYLLVLKIGMNLKGVTYHQEHIIT